MHDHSHHHNLPHSSFHGDLNRPFIIGIGLNLAFVSIEFFYGYLSSSLSLIADAWHNLGDVAGLAISLLALKMAEIKPNNHYTYGYSKGTILATLANCVLLLLAIGSIGYEAVNRLFTPEKPIWSTMSIVASVGVVVNTITALLFMKRSELNSRAAFLHMAADALVSVAVVVGGFVLHYTDYTWIDPALSLLICAVILSGTWKLLKSSLRLSLDGVPDNIDLNAIKKTISEIPEIKNIHHMHIWAISTTKNAMTAHILLQNEISEEQAGLLKSDLKHKFLHLNIHHCTLELETHVSGDPEECENC